jgi:ribosomal protein S18 acetylase RimI-like enzyme
MSPSLSGAAALVVRRAGAADAELLAELGARLFREAFAADNRPDDMALHLAVTFGPELQRRELADPALAYFVAEEDGRAVGYTLVREGSAPACVAGPDPIQLHRIYVERAAQGSGAAAALMAAAVAEARRRGGSTLWLGVWERNARAIRFYEKHGFRDVGSAAFHLGRDEQRDRVMCRDLGAGEGAAGTPVA